MSRLLAISHLVYDLCYKWVYFLKLKFVAFLDSSFGAVEKKLIFGYVYVFNLLNIQICIKVLSLKVFHFIEQWLNLGCDKQWGVSRMCVVLKLAKYKRMINNGLFNLAWKRFSGPWNYCGKLNKFKYYSLFRYRIRFLFI